MSFKEDWEHLNNIACVSIHGPTKSKPECRAIMYVFYGNTAITYEGFGSSPPAALVALRKDYNERSAGRVSVEPVQTVRKPRKKSRSVSWDDLKRNNVDRTKSGKDGG